MTGVSKKLFMVFNSSLQWRVRLEKTARMMKVRMYQARISMYLDRFSDGSFFCPERLSGE